MKILDLKGIVTTLQYKRLYFQVCFCLYNWSQWGPKQPYWLLLYGEFLCVCVCFTEDKQSYRSGKTWEFSFLGISLQQATRLRHWTMKYHGSQRLCVAFCLMPSRIQKLSGLFQCCESEFWRGKTWEVWRGRGKLFQSFWQRTGVPVGDEKGPRCQQGTGCERIWANFRTKEPLSARGQESRFTGEVVKSNHKTAWARAIRSAST